MEFIKKYIIKIMIFAVVLVMVPINVMAKKDYVTDKITDSNLFNIKNQKIDSSEKIILCAYYCASDNTNIDSAGSCKTTDTLFSDIEYYYQDDIDRRWVINTNLWLKQKMSVMQTEEYIINSDYSFKWDGIGDNVPYSGIYFEDYYSENENWKKSAPYTDLKNSFVCPQYVYYDHSVRSTQDKKNNMELCYANTLEKCKSKDEKNKTTFGAANQLGYNFTRELNEVLNIATLDLETEPVENLLSRYFGSDEDICTRLKSDNSEEFTNLLDESVPTNYFNELITEAINSINPASLNYDFYDFEKLTKLMVAGKSSNSKLEIKYNGESLNAKFTNIKNIYSNMLAESVNYHKNRCLVNDDSLVDSEEVQQSVAIKIEKIVPDYQKIDFTELNCDNLFADFADVIKTAYFLIEIGSIIIVIVLSVLDYAKVFLGDGQDEMKKSNKKLTTRLIVLVVIFLLPALVNLTLKIFNIQGFNSENPLCIEITK